MGTCVDIFDSLYPKINKKNLSIMEIIYLIMFLPSIMQNLVYFHSLVFWCQFFNFGISKKKKNIIINKKRMKMNKSWIVTKHPQCSQHFSFLVWKQKEKTNVLKKEQEDEYCAHSQYSHYFIFSFNFWV